MDMRILIFNKPEYYSTHHCASPLSALESYDSKTCVCGSLLFIIKNLYFICYDLFTNADSSENGPINSVNNELQGM
jgi:hypothetical protein